MAPMQADEVTQEYIEEHYPDNTAGIMSQLPKNSSRKRAYSYQKAKGLSQPDVDPLNIPADLMVGFRGESLACV